MEIKPEKVVILCGGRGTRLNEETEFRPKPLVQIGNMPILWHIMKIYSHFGFRNFILCLGYKGGMIKDYFLNFQEMVHDFTLDFHIKNSSKRSITYDSTSNLEDWKITFVDTGPEAQTGTRIYRIRDYINKNEDFLLTYGDGIADINIDRLLKYHRKMKKTVTVSGVHSLSVFGLIEEENGLVKTFREKPKIEDIISGGFFVCTKKVFNYLDNTESCIFEDKPMKSLAKKKELALYKHEGFWYCMDNQKHVDELNRMWLSGKPPWRIWK